MHNLINDHPIITTLILLAILSILAGILAGLVIFKKLRRNSLKLALVGLSNCLTVFTLIITTKLLNTKKENLDKNPLITALKKKGYTKKRRSSFTLLWLSTPLIMFSIFTWFMIFANTIYYYDVIDNISTLIFVLSITTIPVLMFLLGLKLRKIKKEDKNLFIKLKEQRYSTWTFRAKDKKRIYFVIVFSLIFLILSVSLLQLIILAAS